MLDIKLIYDGVKAKLNLYMEPNLVPLGFFYINKFNFANKAYT